MLNGEVRSGRRAVSSFVAPCPAVWYGMRSERVWLYCACWTCVACLAALSWAWAALDAPTAVAMPPTAIPTPIMAAAGILCPPIENVVSDGACPQVPDSRSRWPETGSQREKADVGCVRVNARPKVAGAQFHHM